MAPNVVIDSLIAYIKNYPMKNKNQDPLVNITRPTKHVSKIDLK